MDEQVIIDLNVAIADAVKTQELLKRLYYHSEFGSFTNRPIINMLISGAVYLADNLTVLREKYRGASRR